MAKKTKKNKKVQKDEPKGLHPETKASVLAIAFIGIAIILILSSFHKAGLVGDYVYKGLDTLFGWGYFLVPIALILASLNALASNKSFLATPTIVGAIFVIISGLGTLDIVATGNGGILGELLGSLEVLFGKTASLVINITVLISAILVTLNVPIRLSLNLRQKKEKREDDEPKVIIPGENEPEQEGEDEAADEHDQKHEGKNEPKPGDDKRAGVFGLFGEKGYAAATKDYKFPPLKLLRTGSEKATVGDLRGSANIIKRTLDSFGIPVEMGEITIGPKVTRYTLKPAEGVKLSRIESLNQDLSLALAAHPIRIEAPIPGKSLVGIEVPNKVASIVRLGSLINYPEFKSSSSLGVPLGRDVAGEPIFTSIAKMPHLLIAGSTGSGKSVTIHSLITSLLYKNSPETLRFIMIDPKKVELSAYEGIPHLLSPVITEGKKAVAALKFAIQEMERRYEILLDAGKRDIIGYNKDRIEDIMPYMVIVIDELADLIATFGREVEGAIVRLAQMARATGIHLVVSTQRPSVEVITGLIKANITSRVALQVASQIDSRTILDMAGAEKLLGGGDMLFISSDYSKPKRIQSSFISEEEVARVVTFIKRENHMMPEDDLGEEMGESLEKPHSSGMDMDEDDDELYEEAIGVIKEAGKASASLLQRRLRVGYARAARLLDIMEAKGVIGPSDGAKAREIYLDSEGEDVYDGDNENESDKEFYG